MHRCMTARKKDDRQRGDQEVVEAYLLCAVDICRLIEMGEGTDGISSQPNHNPCIIWIFLYRVRAVEHWSVNQDTHLVGPKVEEYLQALDGPAGGWGRRGGGKLEFRWNRLLPLKYLVVNISHLFDI